MRLLTGMASNLLREYIDLLVEAIRSKKGVKSGGGSKFDLNKYKSLTDIEEMNKYAATYLDKLGQGSSRAAYLLSGKYALKIAINDKGVGQNRAEVDVFTNPKSAKVVAKVYSADKSYSWVISDVVKPIKSVDEFKQLTGVPWEGFCRFVAAAIKSKKMPDEAPDFVKSVVQTALASNLLRGDLVDLKDGDPHSVIDHWGKTPDGRAVLLDYGFTGEVWEEHYSQKSPAANLGTDKTTPGGKPGAFAGNDEKTVKPAKPANNASTGVNPYGKTAPAPETPDQKTVKPGNKHVAPDDEKTVKPGKNR